MRNHYLLNRRAKIKKTDNHNGENIKQIELSWAAGENTKWNSHLEYLFGSFLTKLNHTPPI